MWLTGLAKTRLRKALAILQIFENPLEILLGARSNRAIEARIGGVRCAISPEMLQYLLALSVPGPVPEVATDGERIFVGGHALLCHETEPWRALLLDNGWIEEDDMLIGPSGVKFALPVDYCTLYEVFIERAYAAFSVAGKEVVDIGANVGDSAIFFALEGASRVHAYEPLPSAFAKIRENVRLNRLEDVIIPYNEAVGSHDGSLRVPSTYDLRASGGFSTRGAHGDAEVRMSSMRRVLSRAHEPYLLKVDCEGCESDALLGSLGALTGIPGLIVEVHSYIHHISKGRFLRALRDAYLCEVRASVGYDPEVLSLLVCSHMRE